jgi:6-phosphogluconolactonase/glucosamine-6-phosphate isomerase/deaminase
MLLSAGSATMPNPAPEHDIVAAAADALRAGFVELVCDLARDAIAERGRFSLAVPGGSVASVLLTGLGAHDVAWPSTDLFWCDERLVPPSHPDSNAGAARAGWLRPLEPAGVRVHAMVAGDEDAEQAVERYTRTLAAISTPPVLDLVVLGVGEDEHVGSIFRGIRRWKNATGGWCGRRRPKRRASASPPPRASRALAARWWCLQDHLYDDAVRDRGTDLPADGAHCVAQRARSCWTMARRAGCRSFAASGIGATRMARRAWRVEHGATGMTRESMARRAWRDEHGATSSARGSSGPG